MATQTQTTGGFRSVQQIARDLNVSDARVYALIKQRKVSYVKIGSSYMIPEDAAAKLIKEKA